MQYEPGEKWRRYESGINAASRIVEVISGKTFDLFVQERIFDPLGMKDTTFYPTDAQRARLVTAHAEEQGHRGARRRAAATGLRPAQPAAAGQRWALLDGARLRASAGCS